MLVKNIVYEDVANYKETSMFIATPRCTLKCDKVNGCQVCQNSELLKSRDIIIDTDKVIQKYLANKLTHAIVFGGLDPIDTFEDLILFIDRLRTRYKCNDTIVIYTGYDKEEIPKEIKYLSTYNNIIIKFGKYLMNRSPKYDELLGVTLASDNQYAEQIS